MRSKRTTKQAGAAGKGLIETRSLFAEVSGRKAPGAPTAWIVRVQPGKGRKRALKQVLQFFVDREGKLVERAPGQGRLLTLRSNAEPSILSTRLPRKVVSVESITQRLGWQQPGAGSAVTVHALTAALAPVYRDLGMPVGTATWVSASIDRKVTQFALHAAESGQRLISIAFPTPEAFIALSLFGWGPGMKALLLALALIALAVVCALIFGSGPITLTVFAAASVLLKAGFFLALLAILLLILDIILEILDYFFPGLKARIQRVRALQGKAQQLKQRIDQKKKDNEDVADDLDELKGLADEIGKELEDLTKDVDADLPGSSGENKKELNDAKQTLKKLTDALKEVKKYLEALTK